MPPPSLPLSSPFPLPSSEDSPQLQIELRELVPLKGHDRPHSSAYLVVEGGQLHFLSSLFEVVIHALSLSVCLCVRGAKYEKEKRRSDEGEHRCPATELGLADASAETSALVPGPMSVGVEDVEA